MDGIWLLHLSSNKTCGMRYFIFTLFYPGIFPHISPNSQIRIKNGISGIPKKGDAYPRKDDVTILD